MKKLIVALSFSAFCSCQYLAPSKSVDEKFVGKWVHFQDIPKDVQPDDHSQDGLISSITKVENTEESYSFALYTGQTVDFSKQDENTLAAIGNDMKVIYVDSTQHIILQINESKGIEFSKLK